MAKWKQLPPSPEAIVRAALEVAAYGVTRADRDWTFEKMAEEIRSLAVDPVSVAAIINKAGEDRR
jgi:hypothetical protein